MDTHVFLYRIRSSYKVFSTFLGCWYGSPPYRITVPSIICHILFSTPFFLLRISPDTLWSTPLLNKLLYRLLLCWLWPLRIPRDTLNPVIVAKLVPLFVWWIFPLSKVFSNEYFLVCDGYKEKLPSFSNSVVWKFPGPFVLATMYIILIQIYCCFTDLSPIPYGYVWHYYVL